ncbi:hypothetical protein ACHAW6_004011 [Cyclotella cf. meneghiniana]
MFLSHWFELSGVNEILAPQNETAADAHQPVETREEDMEDESPIWEILAPRAVATSRSHAFELAGNVDDDALGGVRFRGDLVECQHCHKLTPAIRPRSASVASSTTSASSAAKTETDDSAPPIEIPIDIQQLVMRAAVGAAQTTCCPKPTFDQVYKLFEVCAIPSQSSSRGSNIKAGVYNSAEPSKTIKKLIKLLAKNPILVQSRSANMNNLDGLPDGFTLLHAACYGGNAEVVSFLLQEYILKQHATDRSADDSTNVFDDDLFVLDLNDRDLQGRTALHVAAERGHVDVLEMLREAYEKIQECGDGTDVSDVKEALEGLSMNQKDSTTQTTTRITSPETPNFKTASKGKHKSNSPKPPSRSPPPTFSGYNAPLDLAKRTPLALASTSPVPKAKQNRKVLEKMLYGKGGDPCISGVERTPPKERCGGKIGGGVFLLLGVRILVIKIGVICSRLVVLDFLPC